HYQMHTHTLTRHSLGMPRCVHRHTHAHTWARNTHTHTHYGGTLHRHSQMHTHTHTDLLANQCWESSCPSLPSRPPIRTRYLHRRPPKRTPHTKTKHAH